MAVTPPPTPCPSLLSSVTDLNCSIFKTFQIIVWDEALAGPLDLIARYQFFKDRQVVKSFTLKPGRLPYSGGQVENIVFITRPEVANMDKISDNVKGFVVLQKYFNYV